jgi:hypothetical protein
MSYGIKDSRKIQGNLFLLEFECAEEVHDSPEVEILNPGEEAGSFFVLSTKGENCKKEEGLQRGGQCDGLVKVDFLGLSIRSPGGPDSSETPHCLGALTEGVLEVHPTEIVRRRDET